MGHAKKIHSLQYRPEIDGLRALAVLAVLASHFGLHYFEGGYVGVDIFFVLSGFLITSIIKKKVDEDKFSFKEFYFRRFLRIYPALVVTISLTLVVGYFVLLPNDLKNLGWSSVAANLSFSNLYFWQNMGYFDGAAIEKPLLHTWSLSVEEQFYILFPALFLLIARYCYSYLKTVFFVIFIVSLILAAWAAYEKPTASFFLPITRAWELLVGSFLALHHLQIKNINSKKTVSLAGAIFIVISILGYSEQTVFPGISALLPTIGTAFLLVGVDRHSSIIYSLLTNRVALFVGQISYSLYLIHWPLIVLIQYFLMRMLSPIESLVAFVTCILLATAMWRIIEVPFRASVTNQPIRFVSITALLFLASTTTSILFIKTSGLKSAVPQNSLFEQDKPIKELATRCFFDLAESKFESYDKSLCRINEREKLSSFNVVLLGDSYANHYLTAFYNQLDLKKVGFYQIAAGSCPHLFFFTPEERGCPSFVESTASWVTTFRPDKVILSANWWSYSRDSSLFISLEKTIKYYKAKGIDVVVIGVSPVYPSKVENIALRQAKTAEKVDKKYIIQFDEHLDNRLRRVSEFAGATYYSVYNQLCVDSVCEYGNEDFLYHFDKGHFTYAGAKVVVEKLISEKFIY